MTNLGWIKFAVENNYIPIIDMISIKNIFNSKIKNKNINPWELFFKQPFGYTLKDIKNAKNIYLTPIGKLPPCWSLFSNKFLFNQTLIKNFHKLVVKYTPLTESLNKEVDIEMRKLFGNNNTENGVCVRLRGTDYKNKPKGHNMQPNTTDVIRDTINYVKANNPNWIYLVVEDRDILNKFKKKFGKKLKFGPAKILNYKGSGSIGKTVDGKIIDIKKYIISIIILSKCKNVITSLTSGVFVAFMMTEGFKYIKYYDIGEY